MCVCACVQHVCVHKGVWGCACVCVRVVGVEPRTSSMLANTPPLNYISSSSKILSSLLPL